MITINDLNISRECWEWICGLTEEFEYIRDDNFKYMKESDYIKSKKTSRQFYVKSALTNIQHKRYYDAIVYQAKDRLNDLFLLHKNENNFYEIMESSGVLIIQKSVIYSCPIPTHHIIYTDYENKTIARLAALKWIWEEIKLLKQIKKEI